jgi:hypothetical protein
VTIELTLVDGATGQVIGRSAVAAEDLPEDFGPATELRVGETAWRVESAVPPTRAEYVSAGALRLVLREAPPVRMVDPAELNFSMSSICDTLPPDGGPCGDLAPLVIKDDLWRDVELVGSGHDDAIEENFAAIRRIQAGHRVGPGFAKLHVRTEPRAPLDAVGLTVAEVSAVLGASQRNPVTIDGYGGCIPGGFALSLPGSLVFYGREGNGVAVMAAIDHSAGPASAVAAPLFALMSEHRLSLVDWRSCLRIDDEPGLAQWLGGTPQHLWR